MARKANDPRPAPPIVVYAPLGELKVYELAEAELDQLAAGSSDQLHLNSALAMPPTALAILVTLQTAEIISDRVYVAYLVAFWALAVQGTISLVRWWRSRRSHDQLIQGIRDRMLVRPVTAEQLTSTPAPVDTGGDPGAPGLESDR
jgi:hypothetical protein